MSEERPSILKRKFYSVSSYDELHWFLAPWLMLGGITLCIIGAFLPYWKTVEGVNIKGQDISHAFTVMSIGVLFVLLSNPKSLGMAYRELRENLLKVDLSGYVRKEDLKRGSLK